MRCRAIVVLESNSGYLQLLQLLIAAGDRAKARAVPPSPLMHTSPGCTQQ
jgi:hypothetical protein